MRTILCFGDSNTHGVTATEGAPRLGPCERWPGVMLPVLDERNGGGGWRLVEEGQSGRTTCHDDPIEGAHRNGLTGLLIALETHRPIDVIVIMLGTNDLKMRFSLPASDIALGVERLVQTVRRGPQAPYGPGGRDPAIVLVSPPLVEEVGRLGAMFQGAAATSRRLAPAIRAVAEAHGCAFADAAQVASAGADGVHFEAEDHARLGRLVAQTVQGLP